MKTDMKRTKDYTSDAVKDSVQAAMAKIKACFDKKWAPGKEYAVIKHIHGLLDAEIDKYLAPARPGMPIGTLPVALPEQKSTKPPMPSILKSTVRT